MKLTGFAMDWHNQNMWFDDISEQKLFHNSCVDKAKHVCWLCVSGLLTGDYRCAIATYGKQLTVAQITATEHVPLLYSQYNRIISISRKAICCCLKTELACLYVAMSDGGSVNIDIQTTCACALLQQKWTSRLLSNNDCCTSRFTVISVAY